MTSPSLIAQVQSASPLPIVGQCRPGHFAEAQILQAAGCDYIDEAEEWEAADRKHHVHKHVLKPVCISGAKDLGQALRRISEGAAMIRTYGSNLAETTESLRAIMGGVRRACNLDDQELHAFAAGELGAPFHLVKEVARTKKLPVPLFASGDGIESIADASMVMQLGANGLFLTRNVFNESSTQRLKAFVDAVRDADDGSRLLQIIKKLDQTNVS